MTAINVFLMIQRQMTLKVYTRTCNGVMLESFIGHVYRTVS